MFWMGGWMDGCTDKRTDTARNKVAYLRQESRRRKGRRRKKIEKKRKKPQLVEEEVGRKRVPCIYHINNTYYLNAAFLDQVWLLNYG